MLNVAVVGVPMLGFPETAGASRATGVLLLKDEADFCGFNDMASYGIRSGDSYAARSARPCFLLRWHAQHIVVRRMRATPPPAERAMIIVVLKNGLSFFGLGTAEGLEDAFGVEDVEEADCSVDGIIAQAPS